MTDEDIIKIIINALEKRIPIKPKNDDGLCHCPTCGSYIYDADEYVTDYYCRECGQAIKR